MGAQKAFLNNTFRKEILSDYKANRKYSNLFSKSIEIYRKYYFYRGDQIKLVYSDTYEADDFVEPILERIKDSNIALLSTDLDFTRYISNTTVLINKNWDIPYTIEEFENMFKFKPTKTSVILYKALFGDKSDNITGAIFINKAKFLYPEGIKMLCLHTLNYINENNILLDEFIKIFKTTSYSVIASKTEKNVLEELYIQLKLNDLKLPIMQLLFNNISIIRSQLENRNIDSYIHSNPINQKTNEVIHQGIYGISFKNIFGKSK